MPSLPRYTISFHSCLSFSGACGSCIGCVDGIMSASSICTARRFGRFSTNVDLLGSGGRQVVSSLPVHISIVFRGEEEMMHQGICMCRWARARRPLHVYEFSFAMGGLVRCFEQLGGSHLVGNVHA